MKPINGFLLIEPMVHESFISSDKQTYDEVGTVIARDELIDNVLIPIGCKVYFDSWMARKYPNPNKPDTFYWLVHKDEICAIDE